MAAAPVTTTDQSSITQLKAAAAVLGIRKTLQNSAAYCMFWAVICGVVAISMSGPFLLKIALITAAAALLVEAIWVLQSSVPAVLLAQATTLLLVGLFNLSYTISHVPSWNEPLHGKANPVRPLIYGLAQLFSAVWFYRAYPRYRDALRQTDFFTIGILQAIRSALLKYPSRSLPDVLQLTQGLDRLSIALRPGYAVLVNHRTKAFFVAAPAELRLTQGPEAQTVVLGLDINCGVAPRQQYWKIAVGSVSEYDRWKSAGTSYRPGAVSMPIQASIAAQNRSVFRGIAIGLAIMGVAAALVSSYLFGYWVPFEPSYQELLAKVTHSPAVSQQLGKNIGASWGARGTIREGDGSGYASLRIPVRGSLNDGVVYLVANREYGGWNISNLAIQRGGAMQYLDPPPTPGLRDELPKSGTIYVLPLGEPDQASIADAVRRIHDRYGVALEILPPMTVDASLVNLERHQVRAEELMRRLRQEYADHLADYENTLIAVTNRDLYIEKYDWRYAFGFRQSGLAVLSTARMGWESPFAPQNPLVANVRLRKMLARYVGISALRLSPSSDPTSALYSSVGGPQEVDRMTESFLGANHSWNPTPGEAQPCVNVVASERSLSWHTDCSDKAPPNREMESYLADAATGLFVQRHTDFYLDGAIPIAFQRMYRPEDEHSRAFGIGTNDSFDMFLLGDSQQFSFIDLGQADGGRTHFVRTSPGTGYVGVVFLAKEGGGEFEGATLKWNGKGWDLTRPDGWLYVFPACTRDPRQCAPVIVRDREGRVVHLRRDQRGRLLRIENAEGRTLEFQYDAADRITHAQAGDGAKFDYSYDNGRLVSVESNAGYRERYTYDSANRMLEVWRNDQLVLTNSYDPKEGVLEEMNFGAGRSFKIHYDGYNREARMADITTPDGFLTRFFFDVPGGMTQSFPQRISTQASSSQTR